MQLYTAANSIPCHQVRIVLAEKHVSYERRFVHLDAVPEELKDLNPYNETPTLVDRELVLYDHRVIIEYLDERFPHPPLLPVDPVSRGRARLMLYRIERDWYSLADAIARQDQRRDAARKALHDNLLGALSLFEQKKYFMNDDFGLLDTSLAPLLWRLPGYGITLPSVAKPLFKYCERVFNRESFRSSLTDAEREIRSQT